MHPAPPRVRPFLVELASSSLDVQTVIERAGAGSGGRSRFLRAIYVPEDGRCFLLYEATSARAAARAATGAGLGRVHVTAALAEPG